MEKSTEFYPIVFDNEITGDTVKELIKQIEEVDIKNKILLYTTTPGGELVACDVLVDYLNKKIDNGLKIELIGSGEISSSGFIVFCKTRCKKSFINVFSRVHLGTRQFDYRSSKDKDSVDKFLVAHLDNLNKELMAIYKETGLTDEEIATIENGKDLYLSETRLKEIFK